MKTHEVNGLVIQNPVLGVPSVVFPSHWSAKSRRRWTDWDFGLRSCVRQNADRGRVVRVLANAATKKLFPHPCGRVVTSYLCLTSRSLLLENKRAIAANCHSINDQQAAAWIKKVVTNLAKDRTRTSRRRLGIITRHLASFLPGFAGPSQDTKRQLRESLLQLAQESKRDLSDSKEKTVED